MAYVQGGSLKILMEWDMDMDTNIFMKEKKAMAKSIWPDFKFLLVSNSLILSLAYFNSVTEKGEAMSSF